MTIHPFKTDDEVVAYARYWLRGMVDSLHRNIGICLTADKNKSHAYFPALMTCISFLDLLSGLYAGNVKDHGLDHLQAYARKFLDGRKYPKDELAILYVGFRHKIAHLYHPYFVFDTSHIPRDKKLLGTRRITWTVLASSLPLPIELVPDRRISKKDRRRGLRPPWDVPYSHRFRISLRRLKTDAAKSIYGPTGYLAYLESSRDGREKFAKCMKTGFYPP